MSPQMQFLLAFSPWILGFVGCVTFTIMLFFNEKYANNLEKKVTTRFNTLFDRLPILVKIPTCLILWPVIQGFFLGLLFILILSSGPD